MSTRRFAAALTLALCLTSLGACAGNNASPASSAADSSSPSAPASPADSSPAASSPAAPSPSSSSSAGAQTVTGTVEEGVEPNCRLIKDDAGSHLLVFDDPALRSQTLVGKKVTVTGRSEPKLMSTCQQGIPFVVTSVAPA
ncbi:hypothetical protein ACQP2F_07445 [Actinoplanes sp. CA-030573]|uniref:hypothetical protein n=1 Tax=Actinoplanes sp. CA-030573 TaxID=3239898 RepID=UPI003D8B8594